MVMMMANSDRWPLCFWLRDIRGGRWVGSLRTFFFSHYSFSYHHQSRKPVSPLSSSFPPAPLPSGGIGPWSLDLLVSKCEGMRRVWKYEIFHIRISIYVKNPSQPIEWFKWAIFLLLFLFLFGKELELGCEGFGSLGLFLIFFNCFLIWTIGFCDS